MDGINKESDSVSLKTQYSLRDGLPRVLRRNEDDNVSDFKSTPSRSDSLDGNDIADEIDRGQHAGTAHLDHKERGANKKTWS